MNPRLNYFILVILCLIGRLSLAEVQIAEAELILDSEKEFTIPGNLSRPRWSQNGSVIGLDFYCADSDREQVVICNLNSNFVQKVNFKKNQSKRKTRAPMAKAQNINTRYIEWISKGRKFLALSSFRKKTDIYKIYKIKKSFHKQNLTKEIETFDDKHISYPNSIFSRVNQPYIVFTAGDEKSSNIWLMYNKNPIDLDFGFCRLTKGESICYESRIKMINSRSMRLVYRALVGKQMDIFIKKKIPVDLGSLNDNTAIEVNEQNITNSSYSVEILPRWSPNGRYIAYLSTEGHVDLNNIDYKKGENYKNLKYGLCIYDTNTQVSKEIYYPIYYNSDRESQDVYTWLKDNQTIVLIKSEEEKKNPLIAVNALDGKSTKLNSPLYFPSDITASPSGNKLAVIARVSRAQGDYDFNKLYLIKLKFK